MAQARATALNENKKGFALIAVMAVAAGLLYCSWPLAAYLNPIIAAHHGFASEFGAPGQPYDWLFDVLDVVSGIAVLVVTYVLWRRPHQRNRWLNMALLSYGAFGVLTVVDVLVPMSCLPSIQACGSVWHDPQLIIHGVANALSSFLLLFSAFLLWRLAHIKSSEVGVTVYVILLGWTMFGILSIIYYLYSGPGYLAQQFFITISSLWVIVMPIMYVKLHELPRKSSVTSRSKKRALAR
jgi:hypothetical protein